MACSTCLRRNRPCDELRPRCSQCKRSHLKCTFDDPLQSVTFRNEYDSTLQRYDPQFTGLLTGVSTAANALINGGGQGVPTAIVENSR
jgi:hypothetical protein